MVKPEEIIEEYKSLINAIDSMFEGDQLISIKAMIAHFDQRLVEAPASIKTEFYNSRPGGLLSHMMLTAKVAMKLTSILKFFNVKVTYSNSDLMLVCLFHNIGKIGDLNNEYYQVEDDVWVKQKYGKGYKINEDVSFGYEITDRSLFILNNLFNIKLSEDAWEAISLCNSTDVNKIYKCMDKNSLAVVSFVSNIISIFISKRNSK
jgi:hypothetical protein